MRAEALRLSFSLPGVLLFLLFSLLFIGVLSLLLYRIMWRRLQRIIDEATVSYTHLTLPTKLEV